MRILSRISRVFEERSSGFYPDEIYSVKIIYHSTVPDNIMEAVPNNIVEGVLDNIMEAVRVIYPQDGWLFVDNLPIMEIPLLREIRLRLQEPVWISRLDIRIEGFMNTRQRRWTRYWRKVNREADATDRLWVQPCGEDIFDLNKLFGDEPYEIEENWN